MMIKFLVDLPPPAPCGLFWQASNYWPVGEIFYPAEGGYPLTGISF